MRRFRPLLGLSVILAISFPPLSRGGADPRQTHSLRTDDHVRRELKPVFFDLDAPLPDVPGMLERAKTHPSRIYSDRPELYAGLLDRIIYLRQGNDGSPQREAKMREFYGHLADWLRVKDQAESAKLLETYLERKIELSQREYRLLLDQRLEEARDLSRRVGEAEETLRRKGAYPDLLREELNAFRGKVEAFVALPQTKDEDAQRLLAASEAPLRGQAVARWIAKNYPDWEGASRGVKESIFGAQDGRGKKDYIGEMTMRNFKMYRELAGLYHSDAKGDPSRLLGLVETKGDDTIGYVGDSVKLAMKLNDEEAVRRQGVIYSALPMPAGQKPLEAPVGKAGIKKLWEQLFPADARDEFALLHPVRMASNQMIAKDGQPHSFAAAKSAEWALYLSQRARYLAEHGKMPGIEVTDRWREEAARKARGSGRELEFFETEKERNAEEGIRETVMFAGSLIPNPGGVAVECAADVDCENKPVQYAAAGVISFIPMLRPVKTGVLKYGAKVAKFLGMPASSESMLAMGKIASRESRYLTAMGRGLEPGQMANQIRFNSIVSDAFKGKGLLGGGKTTQEALQRLPKTHSLPEELAPREEALKGLAEKYFDKAALTVSAPGTAAKSGDQVFFLKDGEGNLVSVIKVLRGKADEKIVDEMGALVALDRMGLKKSAGVRPTGVFRSGDEIILMTEPAKGQDAYGLAKRLTKVQSDSPARSELLTTTKKDYGKIADAMGELHTSARKGAPVSKAARVEDAARVRGRIEEMKDSLDPETYKALLKRWDDQSAVYVKAKAAPSVQLHGDGHPGNWFVADDGSVTMIDYGSMHWWNKKGLLGFKGTGDPIDDVVRFTEALKINNKASGLNLTPREIESIQHSFFRQYADATHIPLEKLTAALDYHQTRLYVTAIKHADPDEAPKYVAALKEHLAAGTSVDKHGAALTSLQASRMIALQAARDARVLTGRDLAGQVTKDGSQHAGRHAAVQPGQTAEGVTPYQEMEQVAIVEPRDETRY